MTEEVENWNVNESFMTNPSYNSLSKCQQELAISYLKAKCAPLSPFVLVLSSLKAFWVHTPPAAQNRGSYPPQSYFYTHFLFLGVIPRDFLSLFVYGTTAQEGCPEMQSGCSSWKSWNKSSSMYLCTQDLSASWEPAGISRLLLFLLLKPWFQSYNFWCN